MTKIELLDLMIEIRNDYQGMARDCHRLRKRTSEFDPNHPGLYSWAKIYRSAIEDIVNTGANFNQLNNKQKSEL